MPLQEPSLETFANKMIPSKYKETHTINNIFNSATSKTNEVGAETENEKVGRDKKVLVCASKVSMNSARLIYVHTV